MAFIAINFVGGKNVVYCLSVTDKKALFEIILDDSMVARKIVFLSGNDHIIGDHAKLMVICESKYGDISKVHYFEFK